METLSLVLADIHVGERRRPLDRGKVAEIAASIREIGLLHNITARIVPTLVIDGQEVDEVPMLIAGHHRLEALKSLGVERSDVVMLDASDLQAELAEIDENLIRSELSDAERARSVARRKAIYETLNPEAAFEARPGRAGKSRQVGDNSVPAERFTAATARATGRSERAVQRDAERGTKIEKPVLDQIVGTSLDKGAELDALAKRPVEEQRSLAERAAAGETVTARPLPRPASPPTHPTESALLSRIKADCGQLSAHERQQLLFWLKGNLRSVA